MARAGHSDSAAAAAAASAAAHLVWFRPGDLRLADHEPLHTAASCLQSQLSSDSLAGGPPAPLLVPFFCLDERQLAAAPLSLLGLPQLGPHRLRLLLEACASLRSALQALGSDLLWQDARPEALVGRLVALAAAGGSRAVALHHYVQPGRQSVELEDALAAAFLAAADAHGLPCSVHRYWGHSLYHPADLPYQLWSNAPSNGSSSSSAGVSGPSRAAICERPAPLKATAAVAEATAAGQAHTSPQLGGGPNCGWVSRETGWLAALPLGVMSDFRRALQAHTRVRTPLPAPVAAGSGNGSSSSGDGASTSGGGISGDGTATPVLPPLPPGIAAQAGKDGLLGPLPTDPAAMYAAAGPEAQAALQRLAELTGQCFSGLPPAGSSSWDERSAVPFGMGEQQGLQRLRYYLGLGADGERRSSSTLGAGPPPIANYAESRMGAWGVDSSAKLSPFLSLGCLSPRMVYWEVLRLAAAERTEAECTAAVPEEAAAAAGSEAAGGAGAAAAGAEAARAAAAGAGELPVWREPQKGDTWRWLLMHLGIRDFFIFSAMRNEAALEWAEGMSGRPAEWREDAPLFQRWAHGQTGLPFVDACMRELAATGWMSNRGRQNVANMLTKALQLDWRLGAELFASLLVDHDWTLNRTNWAYNSGVGSDPRDRVFRTVSQGQRYDPDTQLIRAWLPELAGLPAELAHQPWTASPEQLAAARLCLGERPMAGAASEAASSAAGGARPAAAAAAAAAVECAGLHHYPHPVIDPATQIGKGPKARRQ